MLKQLAVRPLVAQMVVVATIALIIAERHAAAITVLVSVAS